MGEVIPIRRRGAAKSDTAIALEGLKEKEASGELEGSILITNTTGQGTEFHVLGSYAERLQLAVLVLVKSLGIVTDKIVATGTAGSTRSDSVNASWDAMPRRRLPKRLREVTKFGELE